jgi:hypothetical protein
MENCWASTLGECSGRISQEHIVSKGCFADTEIGVKGLPWCPQKPRLIRIEKFTDDILCTAHNSSLSSVDEAGVSAFRAIKSIARMNAARADMKRFLSWEHFQVEHYEVDGPLLERWFLKTLINMELTGKQMLAIGPTLCENRPPRHLVRIAFGHEQFKGRAGLYFTAVQNRHHHLTERITYSSQIRDSANGAYVAAAQFSLHGVYFFLCLEPEGMPDGPLHVGEAVLHFLHRPNTITFELDERPSQVVRIRWR